MAPDAKRWGGGGYCQRTSSWAALTLAMLGATVSTSTHWPLARHGHPETGRRGRHLVGACLSLGMPSLRAGQKVPDTGGIAPPPPPQTLHRGALGTLSPLPCLWRWFCQGPRGLARRPQVALQAFHLGDQAVPLLGDLRQPRLGGPRVVIGPG